jgi:hypothetical protein
MGHTTLKWEKRYIAHKPKERAQARDGGSEGDESPVRDTRRHTLVSGTSYVVEVQKVTDNDSVEELLLKKPLILLLLIVAN